ncbi:hypothetical protein P9J64_02275 [Deltaproteobacteria bacterium IMCC39524]|nr:hypothetical protein [Deltaproteobacteria bacterium IMCC39524]
MRHGNLWFHDHHWRTTGNQKKHWQFILQIALIAMLVLMVVMWLFPGSTY